jgi:hypothetical protein
VPFAIAEVLARLFELLPNPPLTTGQVDLLRTDNMASGTLPGLQDLNIQPKAVEEVVPTYVRWPRASEPTEPSIGPRSAVWATIGMVPWKRPTHMP